MMRLNLGCGRHPIAGWTNLDIVPGPGVDVVADLTGPLPFAADSIDEMLLSHVVEHIAAPLPMMQELHRIARPDAVLLVTCPYGSSDDAWEDPTHVRPWFLGSWGYVSQPWYWRADYGYRGDWQADEVHLRIDRRFATRSADEIMSALRVERNVCREMRAVLRAVKPIRAAEAALQVLPKVVITIDK